ncbi:hypothetical protein Hanom_Chr07g00626301 [Helianthus anomalus]
MGIAILEREVKSNFATMKTAESEIRRNLGVCDPFTKRTIKSIIWPPTDKEKIIPLARKFLPNSYDLMSFHEEDILVLTNQQIRCHEKYEVCGKEWTTSVANILKNLLFADPQA